MSERADMVVERFRHLLGSLRSAVLASIIEAARQVRGVSSGPVQLELVSSQRPMTTVYVAGAGRRVGIQYVEIPNEDTVLFSMVIELDSDPNEVAALQVSIEDLLDVLATVRAMQA